MHRNQPEQKAMLAVVHQALTLIVASCCIEPMQRSRLFRRTLKSTADENCSAVYPAPFSIPHQPAFLVVPAPEPYPLHFVSAMPFPTLYVVNATELFS